MIEKRLIVIGLLTIAAIIDVRKRKIPDVISCLILGVGLIDLHIGRSLLGIAFTGLPYFLIALITSRENNLSIGGGDIKLISACAFALGSISFSIAQNIIALTLAVAYSLITKKQKRKDGIPLAPFFLIGGLMTSLLGCC